MLWSLLFTVSVVAATHPVLTQVLEQVTQADNWVKKATSCSWRSYVPPIVPTSRWAEANVKFFTHETASGLIIFSTGHMIAQAQLLACGFKQKEDLKGNARDTKNGAGFYVYTRMIRDSSTLRVGEGSVGAGMDWMFILHPKIMDRDDMWASSSDGMGNLPMKLGAGPNAESNIRLMSGQKFGFDPHAATGEKLSDASSVNAHGGQPAEKMLGTLGRIWVSRVGGPTVDHKHNEQGFLVSIKVRDYVAKIIYKGSAYSTVDEVVAALKDANEELYEQMGGDANFAQKVALAQEGRISSLYTPTPDP